MVAVQTQASTCPSQRFSDIMVLRADVDSDGDVTHISCAANANTTIATCPSPVPAPITLKYPGQSLSDTGGTGGCVCDHISTVQGRLVGNLQLTAAGTYSGLSDGTYSNVVVQSTPGALGSNATFTVVVLGEEVLTVAGTAGSGYTVGSTFTIQSVDGVSAGTSPAIFSVTGSNVISGTGCVTWERSKDCVPATSRSNPEKLGPPPLTTTVSVGSSADGTLHKQLCFSGVAQGTANIELCQSSSYSNAWAQSNPVVIKGDKKNCSDASAGDGHCQVDVFVMPAQCEPIIGLVYPNPAFAKDKLLPWESVHDSTPEAACVCAEPPMIKVQTANSTSTSGLTQPELIDPVAEAGVQMGECAVVTAGFTTNDPYEEFVPLVGSGGSASAIRVNADAVEVTLGKFDKDPGEEACGGKVSVANIVNFCLFGFENVVDFHQVDPFDIDHASYLCGEIYRRSNRAGPRACKADPSTTGPYFTTDVQSFHSEVSQATKLTQMSSINEPPFISTEYNFEVWADTCCAALKIDRNDTGGILTVEPLSDAHNDCSGNSNGTYTTLSSGGGSGAILNVTINAEGTATATVTTAGSDYTLYDVITLENSTLPCVYFNITELSSPGPGVETHCVLNPDITHAAQCLHSNTAQNSGTGKFVRPGYTQDCPYECTVCQSGGENSDGVNITRGVCGLFCSKHGFCGTDREEYGPPANGYDCRKCAGSTFLENNVSIASPKHTPLCPAGCFSCKPGGGQGGTQLVNGVCTDYCSNISFCGTTEPYKTDGIDCRACKNDGMISLGFRGMCPDRYNKGNSLYDSPACPNSTSLSAFVNPLYANSQPPSESGFGANEYASSLEKPSSGVFYNDVCAFDGEADFSNLVQVNVAENTTFGIPSGFKDLIVTGPDVLETTLIFCNSSNVTNSLIVTLLPGHQIGSIVPGQPFFVHNGGSYNFECTQDITISATVTEIYPSTCRANLESDATLYGTLALQPPFGVPERVFDMPYVPSSLLAGVSSDCLKETDPTRCPTHCKNCTIAPNTTGICTQYCGADNNCTSDSSGTDCTNCGPEANCNGGYGYITDFSLLKTYYDLSYLEWLDLGDFTFHTNVDSPGAFNDKIPNWNQRQCRPLRGDSGVGVPHVDQLSPFGINPRGWINFTSPENGGLFDDMLFLKTFINQADDIEKQTKEIIKEMTTGHAFPDTQPDFLQAADSAPTSWWGGVYIRQGPFSNLSTYDLFVGSPAGPESTLANYTCSCAFFFDTPQKTNRRGFCVPIWSALNISRINGEWAGIPQIRASFSDVNPFANKSGARKGAPFLGGQFAGNFGAWQDEEISSSEFMTQYLNLPRTVLAVQEQTKYTNFTCSSTAPYATTTAGNGTGLFLHASRNKSNNEIVFISVATGGTGYSVSDVVSIQCNGSSFSFVVTEVAAQTTPTQNALNQFSKCSLLTTAIESAYDAVGHGNSTIVPEQVMTAAKSNGNAAKLLLMDQPIDWIMVKNRSETAAIPSGVDVSGSLAQRSAFVSQMVNYTNLFSILSDFALPGDAIDRTRCGWTFNDDKKYILKRLAEGVDPRLVAPEVRQFLNYNGLTGDLYNFSSIISGMSMYEAGSFGPLQLACYGPSPQEGCSGEQADKCGWQRRDTSFMGFAFSASNPEVSTPTTTADRVVQNEDSFCFVQGAMQYDYAKTYEFTSEQVGSQRSSSRGPGNFCDNTPNAETACVDHYVDVLNLCEDTTAEQYREKVMDTFKGNENLKEFFSKFPPSQFFPTGAPSTFNIQDFVGGCSNGYVANGDNYNLFSCQSHPNPQGTCTADPNPNNIDPDFLGYKRRSRALLSDPASRSCYFENCAASWSYTGYASTLQGCSPYTQEINTDLPAGTCGSCNTGSVTEGQYGNELAFCMRPGYTCNEGDDECDDFQCGSSSPHDCDSCCGNGNPGKASFDANLNQPNKLATNYLNPTKYGTQTVTCFDTDKSKSNQIEIRYDTPFNYCYDKCTIPKIIGLQCPADILSFSPSDTPTGNVPCRAVADYWLAAEKDSEYYPFGPPASGSYTTCYKNTGINNSQAYCGSSTPNMNVTETPWEEDTHCPLMANGHLWSKCNTVDTNRYTYGPCGPSLYQPDTPQTPTLYPCAQALYGDKIHLLSRGSGLDGKTPCNAYNYPWMWYTQKINGLNESTSFENQFSYNSSTSWKKTDPLACQMTGYGSNQRAAPDASVTGPTFKPSSQCNFGNTNTEADMQEEPFTPSAENLFAAPSKSVPVENKPPRGWSGLRPFLRFGTVEPGESFCGQDITAKDLMDVSYMLSQVLYNAATSSESVCPAKCKTCQAGGYEDDGMPLVNGVCMFYCSNYESGYCGTSSAYSNNGTNCTSCNINWQFAPGFEQEDPLSTLSPDSPGRVLRCFTKLLNTITRQKNFEQAGDVSFFSGADWLDEQWVAQNAPDRGNSRFQDFFKYGFSNLPPDAWGKIPALVEKVQRARAFLVNNAPPIVPGFLRDVFAPLRPIRRVFSSIPPTIGTCSATINRKPDGLDNVYDLRRIDQLGQREIRCDSWEAAKTMFELPLSVQDGSMDFKTGQLKGSCGARGLDSATACSNTIARMLRPGCAFRGTTVDGAAPTPNEWTSQCSSSESPSGSARFTFDLTAPRVIGFVSPVFDYPFDANKVAAMGYAIHLNGGCTDNATGTVNCTFAKEAPVQCALDSAVFTACCVCGGGLRPGIALSEAQTFVDLFSQEGFVWSHGSGTGDQAQRDVERPFLPGASVSLDPGTTPLVPFGVWFASMNNYGWKYPNVSLGGIQPGASPFRVLPSQRNDLGSNGKPGLWRNAILQDYLHPGSDFPGLRTQVAPNTSTAYEVLERMTPIFSGSSPGSVFIGDFVFAARLQANTNALEKLNARWAAFKKEPGVGISSEEATDASTAPRALTMGSAQRMTFYGANGAFKVHTAAYDLEAFLDLQADQTEDLFTLGKPRFSRLSVDAGLCRNVGGSTRFTFARNTSNREVRYVQHARDSFVGTIMGTRLGLNEIFQQFGKLGTQASALLRNMSFVIPDLEDSNAEPVARTFSDVASGNFQRTVGFQVFNTSTGDLVLGPLNHNGTEENVRLSTSQLSPMCMGQAQGVASGVPGNCIISPQNIVSMHSVVLPIKCLTTETDYNISCPNPVWSSNQRLFFMAPKNIPAEALGARFAGSSPDLRALRPSMCAKYYDDKIFDKVELTTNASDLAANVTNDTSGMFLWCDGAPDFDTREAMCTPNPAKGKISGREAVAGIMRLGGIPERAEQVCRTVEENLLCTLFVGPVGVPEVLEYVKNTGITFKRVVISLIPVPAEHIYTTPLFLTSTPTTYYNKVNDAFAYNKQIHNVFDAAARFNAPNKSMSQKMRTGICNNDWDTNGKEALEGIGEYLQFLRQLDTQPGGIRFPDFSNGTKDWDSSLLGKRVALDDLFFDHTMLNVKIEVENVTIRGITTQITDGTIPVYTTVGSPLLAGKKRCGPRLISTREGFRVENIVFDQSDCAEQNVPPALQSPISLVGESARNSEIINVVVAGIKGAAAVRVLGNDVETYSDGVPLIDVEGARISNVGISSFGGDNVVAAVARTYGTMQVTACNNIGKSGNCDNEKLNEHSLGVISPAVALSPLTITPETPNVPLSEAKIGKSVCNEVLLDFAEDRAYCPQGAVLVPTTQDVNLEIAPLIINAQGSTHRTITRCSAVGCPVGAEGSTCFGVSTRNLYQDFYVNTDYLDSFAGVQRVNLYAGALSIDVPISMHLEDGVAEFDMEIILQDGTKPGTEAFYVLKSPSHEPGPIRCLTHELTMQVFGPNFVDCTWSVVPSAVAGFSRLAVPNNGWVCPTLILNSKSSTTGTPNAFSGLYPCQPCSVSDEATMVCSLDQFMPSYTISDATGGFCKDPTNGSISVVVAKSDTTVVCGTFDPMQSSSVLPCFDAPKDVEDAQGVAGPALFSFVSFDCNPSAAPNLKILDCVGAGISQLYEDPGQPSCHEKVCTKVEEAVSVTISSATTPRHPLNVVPALGYCVNGNFVITDPGAGFENGEVVDVKRGSLLTKCKARVATVVFQPFVSTSMQVEGVDLLNASDLLGLFGRTVLSTVFNKKPSSTPLLQTLVAIFSTGIGACIIAHFILFTVTRKYQEKQLVQRLLERNQKKVE